jgi:hypothetical protein
MDDKNYTSSYIPLSLTVRTPAYSKISHLKPHKSNKLLHMVKSFSGFRLGWILTAFVFVVSELAIW